MKLEAKAIRRDDGKIVLTSPEVGLWREGPQLGDLVRPGSRLGRIEILGELKPVFAPEGAAGIVEACGGDAARTRRPVGHGAMILVLDPEGAIGAGELVAEQAAGASSSLVFAAPSSGRFYRRPAPDKPPFVQEGDEITRGHTVAMLEVMKTFHRIHYEGSALPERARVLRIVPADGDDLGPGDPILELESADG